MKTNRKLKKTALILIVPFLLITLTSCTIVEIMIDNLNEFVENNRTETTESEEANDPIQSCIIDQEVTIEPETTTSPTESSIINQDVTTVTYGDFIFNPDANMIIKYTGTQAKLEIPAAIGGAFVRIVAVSAFEGNNYVSSITIPSSVTEIKTHAFYNCFNLDTILIYGSSVQIEDDSVLLGNDFRDAYIIGGAGTYTRQYGGKWDKMNQVINAVKVSLDKDEMRIPISKDIGYPLAASIEPSDTNLNSIKWKSSNNSVADIIRWSGPGWQNAGIKGYSVGTAIITAKTEDNSSASCNITVYEPVIDGYFNFDPLTSTIVEYTGTQTTVEIPGIIKGIPVKTIGYEAFCDNDYIVSVKIPSNIKKIENDAFYDCNNLNIITIDAKVMIADAYSIGDGYFRDAYEKSGKGTYAKSEQGFWHKIDNIVSTTGVSLDKDKMRLPISTIGYKLDVSVQPSDATNKGIVWTNSNTSVVEIIDNWTGNDGALIKGLSAGTSVLTATTLDGNHIASCTVTVYKPLIEGNFLFDTETGTIAEYTGTQTILDIPDTIAGIPVQAIGYEAFHNNIYLSSATLPSSLKIIGSYAFGGCRNITSVFIPSNVTLIEEGAFSGCDKLSSLNFDENSQLIEIENHAFSQCPIMSLQLPKKIISIGDYAFSGNRFSTLKIPENVKSIGKNFDTVERSLFIVEIGSGVQISEGCIDLFEDAFRKAYINGGAGLYSYTYKYPYDWFKIDKIINMTEVSFEHSNLDIHVSQDTSLRFKFYPSDATNRAVIVTSSNPSVVRISQPTYFTEAGYNGWVYLYPRSLGTVIITATTEDGGYTATCTITVIP